MGVYWMTQTNNRATLFDNQLRKPLTTNSVNN